ncbi:hypothetical protein [Pseudonocardia sp. GCM10023141]|uniref:hypothetical protein n=1 Tax=Pseudonocardia sp. GCM10023141 TaxID=3252653 RepID=UPI00360DB127
MNSKKLAGAGAAAIAAATAVAVLVLGSTTAVAAEARPASAYGLSASGALHIDPIPAVVSRDGKLVRDELLGLSKLVPGAANGGLTAGLFTVQAQRGAAETSVAQLNLAGLLRADLIRTSCVDGHGKLQIVNGSVLGTPLPTDSESRNTINVSPLLRVSLGGETRNGDGSVTVTGIKLELLPAGKADVDKPLTASERSAVPALGDLLGTKLDPAATVGGLVGQLTSTLGKSLDFSGSLQTITIGSATCGGDAAQQPEEPAEATPVRHAPDQEDAPEAPVPTIVDGDLPVTH